jgi:hypothetical protein
MPSDKRAFEKDKAGAALEPAKRPCPGAKSGDGVEMATPWLTDVRPVQLEREAHAQACYPS